MKIEKTIIIISIIVILINVGLTGCNENLDNSKNSVNFVSYPVFSDIDRNILDTTYDYFDTCRQSFSLKDSREKLLNKLNNETEGVELAELGIDGYTIFVSFSDGDLTAIDTFSLDGEDSLPNGGGFFSQYSNEEIIESKEHLFPIAGLTSIEEKEDPLLITHNLIVVGPEEKTTCESNDLLVLAPCYWEFPREPTDDCVQFFKDNGWEDHDITLKYARDHPSADNTDCLELTPEDYFDIEKYGIVLFTGHGTIWARHSFEEDNLYLQFCYLTNKSFVDNKLLQEWKDQQKLIIFRKYTASIDGVVEYVYASVIRADLLREMMTKKMPSSYCYFATCYGGYFNQVYLDAGAKVFLSWDNLVEAEYADGNMKNIAQLMLEGDLSVSEAYADEQIIKSYQVGNPQNPIRGVVPSYYRHNRTRYVNFNIYPDPDINPISSSFYMPAWIDLEISGILDGTDFVQVDVYDNDTNLLVSDRETVPSGESQIGMTTIGGACYPPTEEYTIEVTAFYSPGSPMTSNSFSTMLSVGENDLELRLTKYFWNLSGGEDPTDHIKYTNAFGLVIRLNEDTMVSESTSPNRYFYFWAFPGDELRVRLMNWARPGECYSMGPLWLHCRDTGDSFKLSDGGDLGCWDGPATDGPIDLFDETFIIPEV